jgi:ribosomal protein L7/L12
MTITLTFSDAEEYALFLCANEAHVVREGNELRDKVRALSEELEDTRKALAVQKERNEVDKYAYKFNLSDLKEVLKSTPDFYLSNKICTIKLVRKLTGMDLKAAKDWVFEVLNYKYISVNEE